MRAVSGMLDIPRTGEKEFVGCCEMVIRMVPRLGVYHLSAIPKAQCFGVGHP